MEEAQSQPRAGHLPPQGDISRSYSGIKSDIVYKF